jgi:hypothetical protein
MQNRAERQRTAALVLFAVLLTLIGIALATWAVAIR